MSSIIPFRDTKLIYRLFTNLIIKDVKVRDKDQSNESYPSLNCNYFS